MTAWVCATCGTQFAPSESQPETCPICTDPRQYVPPDGQRWTTLEELRTEHTVVVRPEGELTGVGMEPAFAIGQRALLVPFGDSNLMWDCTTAIDAGSAEEVQRRGGLAAIAISHPHYYSGMVEWAHAFGCPIFLHAADQRWIMRPDPAIRLWEGETEALGHGLTLIRCGGHFAGGTVLHAAGAAGGRGALLAGDIVQVIPDRTYVAFMYSYPNLIPLPEAHVRAIGRALEPFAFEPIYGAWWESVIERDGPAVVGRSVERYARALGGELQVEPTAG